MELTEEGKELGRKFRKQANFYLEEFNNSMLRNDPTAGRDADIAIMSLLAAIMAYLDPDFDPKNNGH